MSGGRPTTFLYYPKRKGNEYYIKTKDHKVIFTIRDNEPIYAKDKHGNEIYPEENGVQVFIKTSKGPIYAKNALKQEIYPKDKQKNDKPILTQSGVQYAKDKDGNELYPKLADGNEILYDRFAYTATGVMKYPLYKDKRPQYEKDSLTKDEIYHINPNTGTLVIGKDKDGNEVYAKKANGDEFYPAMGIHAKTKDGFPIYAVSDNGEIIFPKDVEGNEYYLKDKNDYDIIYSAKKLLPRYAKDKYGTEIYPVQEMISDFGSYMEVIIREKYALRNNEPYYPLDAYGNEYIIHKKDAKGNFDEEASFPISYPITNDKLAIIPKVKNKPYILKNGVPYLTSKNIMGLLFRDRLGFHDFITHIYSIRDSRSTKKMYKILLSGSSREVIRNRFIHNRVAKTPTLPDETPKKKGIWSSFILLIVFAVIGCFIFFAVRR